MFSARVPSDLAPNRLSQALQRARAQARQILDLTESNPTRANFDYPADLLEPLADARGLRYRPEPFGLAAAREAVAGDFGRRGISVGADRIALTASTSEAYSFIFKLLCDPDDEVLVPRPSYPLFEHLTRLDSVKPVPYDLEYSGTWWIDFSSVERALSSRTRALLVVNPNNPTGNLVRPEEMGRLAEACAAHQAAIVADEVFADYRLAAAGDASGGQLTDRTDVLGFTVGGLSKSIGLPQAKLGWIAVSGDAAVVRDALARLELVCDTYLSVSTPVQVAAAELLKRGATVRQQILERIRTNYRDLLARAARTPACSVLQTDAGWYAVVQVPSFMPEEDLVLTLLEQDDVLVHPGYFFDFATESFLVVSLLTPSASFAEGTSRIFRHFDCSAVTHE